MAPVGVEGSNRKALFRSFARSPPPSTSPARSCSELAIAIANIAIRQVASRLMQWVFGGFMVRSLDELVTEKVALGYLIVTPMQSFATRKFVKIPPPKSRGCGWLATGDRGLGRPSTQSIPSAVNAVNTVQKPDAARRRSKR